MHPSAKYYTPLSLALYDFFVLQFSNSFAWLCPTSTFLLPFFIRHFGRQTHLDVGVGTGYYPSQAVKLLPKTEVTLLDLNPNSLQKSASRLESVGYPRGTVQTYVHDVFTPVPDELKGKFDAVSIIFLLHCLHGPLAQKGPGVFSQLAPALKKDGTLYGATILGVGVQHNWIGRRLMRFYNHTGFFGNNLDSEDELRAALEAYFEDVEVRVVGVVALFVGKRPRVPAVV